ncbi:MAG TPA: DNA repair protein RecO [Verrucomicrobiae bacterium]|nr:DNA repair protein RecO [Verrucomicrobiae bacterium]
MKRVPLEPGFLLSVRPYRETSALLEALTAGHGRVGLVARGVRGAKSRLRGLLQPFQPLLLSWSEGGELGTLTGAEAAGRPATLAGEAVFSGWYLNELVLRLLPRRDAHPELYSSYCEALAALGGEGGVRALRVFELHLLAELGYAVHVPETTEPESWYGYDPEGGLRLAEPGPDAYRGASLLALAEESLQTEESLRDARRLLRAALKPHLGDRALRTPEMLRALRGIRDSGSGIREERK